MGGFENDMWREILEKALSREFSEDRKIAVYGAGDSSLRAIPCFEMMGDDLVYFIDDTPSKYGTLFFGKRVISFEEAHELCKSFIVLVCSLSKKTEDTLFNLLYTNPIEGVVIGTPEEYVFCREKNKVLAVYDMLADEKSKETYANMILYRMGKIKLSRALIDTGKQYFSFPEIYTWPLAEVFVDCGGFVGDTLEQAIMANEGPFEKTFVFEPDRNNFQALQYRVERLTREWNIDDNSICLINAGVGEKDQEVQIIKDVKQGGISTRLSAREEGKDAIQVFSLDNYFSEQKISFLKADIEGFEYPMLMGAQHVIKRDQPVITICIYHSACDMYRVPLKLKEICPEYQFAVRQYRLGKLETVLYAWVSNG